LQHAAQYRHNADRKSLEYAHVMTITQKSLRVDCGPLRLSVCAYVRMRARLMVTAACL
jgi:hypothetical protein